MANKFKMINQIFSAVAYAHSKNIIHRDIKPSNIIVNDQFNIKIIDFGISKIVDSIYDDFTLCGYRSPKYASWEQKKGIETTFQSDIYSLGILIYEILTGIKLPNDHNIHNVIENDKEFNDAQKSIMLKMVAKDLEQRYLTINEVRNDFSNSWEVDTNIREYNVKITNNVINRLYEFGFITRVDKNNAINIIENDLEHGSFFEDFKNKNNNLNCSYRILGKQFEMICVVENDGGLFLVMTDIRFPRADILEKNKEFAMKLNFKWCVRATNFFVPEEADDIKELITMYDEYKKINNIKKSNEHGQKSIIDLWSKVLRLQRRTLNEEKNTLQYRHFEVESGSDRIHIHLDSEISVTPFSEDQLLNMTSKYNIAKMKTAGYLVDVKR